MLVNYNYAEEMLKILSTDKKKLKLVNKICKLKNIDSLDVMDKYFENLEDLGMVNRKVINLFDGGIDSFDTLEEFKNNLNSIENSNEYVFNDIHQHFERTTIQDSKILDEIEDFVHYYR